jgi:hypothetical protein
MARTPGVPGTCSCSSAWLIVVTGAGAIRASSYRAVRGRHVRRSPQPGCGVDASRPVAPPGRRRDRAQSAGPVARDRARVLPPARRGLARRRRGPRGGARSPLCPARPRGRPRPRPRSTQPLAVHLHRAPREPAGRSSDDLLANRTDRAPCAPRTTGTDRPRGRRQQLAITIDSRERYPYRFAGRPVSPRRAAPRCRPATTPWSTAIASWRQSSARRLRTSSSRSSMARSDSSSPSSPGFPRPRW